MSMAFTFLNVVLSMTASLGNFLILLALHKVTSIYPPTKLLFRCLAVTDLFVGVITQPLFTVTLLREEIMYFSEKLFEITYFIREVSSFFLCGVSVLTSTAISVDRLLALSMGLRYKRVVTLRRVQALIIFLWLLVGALVGFDLILFVLFFAQAVLILISLIISVIVYANIFTVSASTASCTGPCSPPTTVSQRCFTDLMECSTIQENSFCSSMGTAWIICVLFAVWCAFDFDVFWRVSGRSSFFLSSFLILLKLISEPHSLLLENQGSETSSKGHN